MFSLALMMAGVSGLAQAASCGDKPVFLSFDTGHMGVAPLVAETLRRYDAKVTFFLANEPTLTGGATLDEQWAPWWRARVAEGHDFGSHTWDHDIWMADLPTGNFKMKRMAGKAKPVLHEMTPRQYCEDLRKPAQRFREMTGQAMAPLFRAPSGKTSEALIAAAKACGFTHVGWSAAGYLGDDLPDKAASNEVLLQRALRDIRPGDVLIAHLGIWSRQQAWAPEVLDPLMRGLKAKGMCFAPLREHPVYGPLVRGAAPAHPASAS
ncbi:MAG: polysaccharide deacetylase family protein [Burkholderiaceae bacterium]|nr:polysaccharide deacetylase family protein [Roseateles sp.]MBV8470605.1 polysaccharide deacetylase family protein [Burkholderiaceae bacterium]